MRLYRRIRLKVRDLLDEVQHSGFNEVRIQGEGEIADICRLTCLEQQIKIVDSTSVPVLLIEGTKVQLQIKDKV
jgi:hypothetical protein